MVGDVLLEDLELRAPLLVVSRELVQLLDDQIGLSDSVELSTCTKWMGRPFAARRRTMATRSADFRDGF